jgi:hypothetical protein
MKLESYFKSEEEKSFVKRTIEQDIFCLGNELQELYAAQNECWFEDMENLYAPLNIDKEDYKEFITENFDLDYNDAKAAMKEFLDNDYCENYSPYDNYYNEYIESLKDDQLPQDVMQWFIVSDYLAKKLSEIGEPILNTNNHNLWGRTCCGQSIELDGTFQNIFRNLK